MSVTIPIIAADGAKSTVTLAAPVVAQVAKTPLVGSLEDNPGNMCSMPGTTAGVTQQASWDFLYSQGVRIVRFVLYWETLQLPLTPVLDANKQPITATGKGPLTAYHMDRLCTEITNAHKSGLWVFPVILNYARYTPGHSVWPNYSSPTYVFNEPGPNYLPVGDFIDFWTKASAYFKGTPGLYGYDIMNEPHDMPGSSRTEALVWESYSQQCVNALRSLGDNTTVIMEGMNFSMPFGWSTLHPRPWINDPANNIIYSPHQYTNWTTGTNETNNLTYNGVASAQGQTPQQMHDFGVSGATEFANWVKAHPGTRCGLGETGAPSAEAMEKWMGLSTTVANSNGALWNQLETDLLNVYLSTGTLQFVTQWSAQSLFWAPHVNFYSSAGVSYLSIGGKNVPPVYDRVNSNWAPVKAISPT